MSQIREPCYFYTQKAASYIKGGDYEVKHNPVVFVVFSEDFYPLDDDKYQSCLCRSLNLANEYNIDVSYSDKEDLAKAIYFDLYQRQMKLFLSVKMMRLPMWRIDILAKTVL